MAILNIKNLPDEIYQRLRVRARLNRRSVTQEVTSILESAVAEPDALSLMDLRGLGRSAWKSVDVRAFLDAERGSWD